MLLTLKTGQNFEIYASFVCTLQQVWEVPKRKTAESVFVEVAKM